MSALVSAADPRTPTSKRGTTPRRVRLTSVTPGSNAIFSLSESLRAGKLAALELWGVGLVASDAKQLGRALMAAPPNVLTMLDLGGNPELGDVGALALVAGVGEAAGLLSLGLDGTGLGDNGGRAVAQALRQSRSLTSIKLQNNVLTDVAALELAQSIRSAVDGSRSTLTQLLLQRNRIGDRGATGTWRPVLSSLGPPNVPALPSLGSLAVSTFAPNPWTRSTRGGHCWQRGGRA